MKTTLHFFFGACIILMPACDRIPGKPTAEDRWQSPASITDFRTLYNINCRGCHSDGNTIAGSLSMNNPTYLAIIEPETLRNIIANGIPGTSMPAFSRANGGPLDDKQLDSVVNGILAWKKPIDAVSFPPYSAPPGDLVRGATVFAASCANCHGTDGKGGAHGGSVVDLAYLNLVSDQYLRTIVISGRNDLGMPDWRNEIAGRSMSDQEIADVVAWMASQRKNEFGQSLIPPNPN